MMIQIWIKRRELVNEFKNQTTVCNAEWKDETNCQNKRDQNNEIVVNVKPLLREEIHRASGGRNVLNQYQKLRSKQ